MSGEYDGLDRYISNGRTPTSWTPRTWPAAGDSDFTIIALPDTQNYADAYYFPGQAQTKWIAQFATQLNIQMVLHEGDLVNTCAVAGMSRARVLMDRLKTVPNLIAPGNHDYAGEDPTSRDLTVFNAAFPSTRYTGAGWFNGALKDAGVTENVYTVVTIGIQDYLFMALEYAPQVAVVAWADGILTANPTALCFLVTHNYLQVDDARSVEGEALWTNLIKLHDNIICVLCGHLHAGADGMGYRVDNSDGGQPVHQIEADYQAWAFGGNGYLRVMRVVPTTRTIYIETYSPYADAWQTDAANEFSVVY